MDKAWCDWRNPVAIVSSENALSLLKMHHHMKMNIPLPKRPTHHLEKETQTRNVTWFNTPFSKEAKISIGKIFLKMMDKHFPLNHKYIPLFNRYNLK